MSINRLMIGMVDKWIARLVDKRVVGTVQVGIALVGKYLLDMIRLEFGKYLIDMKMSLKLGKMKLLHIRCLSMHRQLDNLLMIGIVGLILAELC